MYDVDDILFEYERLLDGKRKSLNISCVYGEKMREEAFGTILRYVLRDKILKWTAAEAIELFNDQIAKEYKIDKAYGLINYDPRLYYPKSYLLRYAYPEEIEYDFCKETVEIYRDVLSGAVYPKRFFDGDIGKERAAYLLYLNLDKDFFDDYSITALYQYFKDQKKAAKYLKRVKLMIPLKKIYGYGVIEAECTKYYFLDSLPNDLYKTIKFDKLES